ncbi:TPA: glycosyltransferase [Vibrio alginolyticus]|nr:glycosyltransferase [Vibrio alginolyticus]EII5413390.1 glycosyltransferase [Vibrio alginolyticus]EJG0480645.1 glycosyltransferase [Vibrio alginolyticus]
MHFSVVITTKDRLDFLKRAVRSILLNSILPTDVVIVNDGGSPVYIEDLHEIEIPSGNQVDFKIINNSESMGGNKARNLGVSVASSDIIFLLDDDDSFVSNGFESRLKFFNDPSVGIVFTGINLVKSSNLNAVVRKVFPLDSKDYYVDLLKKGNLIGSTSRVAIRKEYFYSAGQFDENLSSFQDFDLWIRMSRISKVKNDSAIGVNYTIHDTKACRQISSSYTKYINSGEYLVGKYYKSTEMLGASSQFESTILFRVSQSASSVSYRKKMLFGLQAFKKSPSLKKFIFSLLPHFLVVRIYPFV